MDKGLIILALAWLQFSCLWLGNRLDDVTIMSKEERRNELNVSNGSLRLQCHRCGWEGAESELDVNEYGEACPKCPQFRDIHASLSEVENART